MAPTLVLLKNKSSSFLNGFLSSFPGGSDLSLLQKFNDHHANHENYGATQLRDNRFEIIHYAGTVTYKIDVSIHTVEREGGQERVKDRVYKR